MASLIACATCTYTRLRERKNTTAERETEKKFEKHGSHKFLRLALDSQSEAPTDSLPFPSFFSHEIITLLNIREGGGWEVSTPQPHLSRHVTASTSALLWKRGLIFSASHACKVSQITVYVELVHGMYSISTNISLLPDESVG